MLLKKEINMANSFDKLNLNTKLIEGLKKEGINEPTNIQIEAIPLALENKDIIKMHYRNAKALYTQRNNIKLYFHGKEKFKDLFYYIDNAKKYIHIQYYIIQPDELGSKLMDLLTKKSKEGVEVRLLFDAMGSSKFARNNKKFLKPFKEAGGKYAIFFPGSLFLIGKRVNYRNHRKIVVIDGETAFLGGFNVGNEYIGEDKKIGNWRDTHMKIEGEAINQLQGRFLMDWTYASKEDINDYTKYFSVLEYFYITMALYIIKQLLQIIPYAVLEQQLWAY
jgi:cardiolipin synthase